MKDRKIKVYNLLKADITEKVNHFTVKELDILKKEKLIVVKVE